MARWEYLGIGLATLDSLTTDYGGYLPSTSLTLDSLFAFAPRRAAALDTILAEAAARDMSFELVISEKDEYLLNHLAPDGLPDPNGGHFNERANTPTHRLHESYWRYLFARFGAFRSVHSWELVNEASPDFGDHFRLAADLANAAADGNPHLVTTSTWATLAEAAWKNPERAPIDFANIHSVCPWHRLDRPEGRACKRLSPVLQRVRPGGWQGRLRQASRLGRARHRQQEWPRAATRE